MDVSGWRLGKNKRHIPLCWRCPFLAQRSSTSKEVKIYFELGASASALKQLEGGSVEAGVHLTSSEKLGLDIAGDGGVVGLGLFKLSLITKKMKAMAGFSDAPENPGMQPPSSASGGFETHLTWPADLEDDI